MNAFEVQSWRTGNPDHSFQRFIENELFFGFSESEVFEDGMGIGSAHTAPNAQFMNSVIPSPVLCGGQERPARSGPAVFFIHDKTADLGERIRFQPEGDKHIDPSDDRAVGQGCDKNFLYFRI